MSTTKPATASWVSPYNETESNWPFTLADDPTGPKVSMDVVSADLYSTSDGQTINAKDVNGYHIYIEHNNVTVTNFRCRAVRKTPGKTGLVIEDGIIDGQDTTENAVEWNEYTARRIEVTGTVDAFKAHGNVLIEDCYIHDLDYRDLGGGNYTHNDCMQMSSGTNVTVRRCRMERTRGNAGLYVQPDQGTIGWATLEDNYFDDVGNHMIYIKESVSAPGNGLPDLVTVTGNVFGPRPTWIPEGWGTPEDNPMMAEVRADSIVWENNVQESSGLQTELNAWDKAMPV